MQLRFHSDSEHVVAFVALEYTQSSVPGRSPISWEHPLQCVLSKSAVLSGSLKNDAVLR